MIVNAEGVSYEQLNRKIRECSDKDIIVENCMGHRYIGAGICEKNIIVQGVPGNAIGAYLHGGSITVMGNAQDAAGDTMNSGVICVHGSVGDAAGYAMRGGTIYIRDDAGYRAGVQRYVEGYCSFFGGDPDMLMQAGFHTLKPDEKQKYTQIYVDI